MSNFDVVKRSGEAGGCHPNKQVTAGSDRELLELTENSECYHLALAAELRPQSTLAAILVKQLGRHAAGLDLAAAAKAAAIRFASQNPQSLQLFEAADAKERPFLAILANALFDTAGRNERRHATGFFKALRAFREISCANQPPRFAELFNSEATCVAYLAT